MQREAMVLDVAIRLKQLAAQDEREISVCLIEKGAEIGAGFVVVRDRSMSAA